MSRRVIELSSYSFTCLNHPLIICRLAERALQSKGFHCFQDWHSPRASGTPGK